VRWLISIKYRETHDFLTKNRGQKSGALYKLPDVDTYLVCNARYGGEKLQDFWENAWAK
jgi:hypothetical protein